jgi:hypothetical protein
MAQNAPMEKKVSAAGWTALVAGFLVSWVVTAVPGLAVLASPLQAVIVAALTSAAAFVAGWLANHTPRPGDNPPVPPAGM